MTWKTNCLRLYIVIVTTVWSWNNPNFVPVPLRAVWRHKESHALHSCILPAFVHLPILPTGSTTQCLN